jgi:hypothetical protein
MSDFNEIPESGKFGRMGRMGRVDWIFPHESSETVRAAQTL